MFESMDWNAFAFFVGIPIDYYLNEWRRYRQRRRMIRDAFNDLNPRR